LIQWADLSNVASQLPHFQVVGDLPCHDGRSPTIGNPSIAGRRHAYSVTAGLVAGWVATPHASMADYYFMHDMSLAIRFLNQFSIWLINPVRGLQAVSASFGD
jgi:hypothetical protein